MKKNTEIFLNIRCTPLFSILLIAALGVIIYSNSLHCSFHFDDNPAIFGISAVKDISNLKNIWDFWPSRFITYLSMSLNYHFNGLNVFGYHLFNLGVHLISAILVWWLTRLTLSAPLMEKDKIVLHANAVSLLVGLLFVSHPIQTQGVTYIIQRAASMATLFYLASLSLFVKSRLLQIQEPGSTTWKSYYIWSLVMAIAAMFTKETAITLPLMILLYEYSFIKTKRSINWMRQAPFLLTMLIIPSVVLVTKTEITREIHDVLEGPKGMSPDGYLLSQFRVMVTYIRLVLLPVNQNLDYDYPVFKSIFELPVFISFLSLAAILIFAANLFSKYRLVSFSIFWFFGALLPESSLLPSQDVIFEHRLYLPLVGYSLFLVSGLYYLIANNNIKIMTVILMVVIACNAVLTYQRNKVWKDDLSLWNDAVLKSPHKSRPYNNRGIAYYRLKGSYEKAISDYSKAILLNNTYAEAYNNRGLAYDAIGHYDQAIFDCTRAIKLEPQDSNAYYNRGFAYDAKGNYDQAISDFNQAIRLNPQYADAYNNRGFAYDAKDNHDQAIYDYSKAIELDPQQARAYNNRGRAYGAKGNYDQAIYDYNKVIDIAQSYFESGMTNEARGNYDQAMSDFSHAKDLAPIFAQAYYNQAKAYYLKQEYDKAWQDVHKAEALGLTFNQGFLKSLKKVSSSEQD